jgi:TetR/AcrR family transcriptional repressor of bet genes
MRRQELEKAAYDAINARGSRGLALEEVARQAGTVKGTIHHYFQNKEELMESAARYANREFSHMALESIKAAKSSSERLWSIVALNLSPQFFQPFLTRAYVVILANGIRYKGVLRIYDATHARTVSNIAFALRPIVKPEDVESIANTIWTMIEGAWVLQATSKDNIVGATLAQLAEYLNRAVPGFDSSVARALQRRK